MNIIDKQFTVGNRKKLLIVELVGKIQSISNISEVFLFNQKNEMSCLFNNITVSNMK